MNSSVAGNLSYIKSTLPPHVQLIAVSKTKPIVDLIEAYAAGQRDFGENKVQELLDKQSKLPKDIRWHFIGHLQTNKVKQLIPFVYLIQSVDSIKLLDEIQKQAQKINRKIDVLLQVYIAQEDTKFGFDIQEIKTLLSSNFFTQYPNVHPIGFMGMASNTANTKIIEREFNSLFLLFNETQKQFPAFNTLSMGMSSDYQMAIKQGSTMIRLGSTLFGTR